MKLLTAEQRTKLLANGANSGADHIPVVKLFTAAGSCTWLLTEIDPENPDIAFGLCDLGFGTPELGSVSLVELGSVRDALGLPIERDLYCTLDKPISHYAEIAYRKGCIDLSG